MTPLQMAMVAAAVANGGKLMEPHLTDRIVDRDGRTVDRIQPREMSQVMSAEAAGEVGDMMGKVVEEGTGTAAALEGISVGGKTGTAEVDRPCGPTRSGSSRSRRAHDPKVAIAATSSARAGPAATSPRRSPSRSCRSSSSDRAARSETIVDGRYRVRQPRRLGRDGRRLLRRGPAARAQRRAEGPPQPLRRGRRVRRALPPRGAQRRRASTTRTSSRSTTAASGTAPTTSRWSTSTGAR